MAYSLKARWMRRCIGTRKDGEHCQAYAMWDDSRGLCIRHSGRWQPNYNRPWWDLDPKTKYEPCKCIAYNWPHRPGGGICNWPDEPEYRLTTPESTHRGPRMRMPLAFREPKRRRRRGTNRRR